MKIRHAIGIVVMVACVLVSSTSLAEEPVALMLSWQQDPTTTMTIDWHIEDEESGGAIAYYKRVGDEDWQEVEGTSQRFPHSDRTIHRVEITGLEPASEYRFRVSDFDRAYMFRTMPTEIHERPLVFATGGDTRHNQSWMEQTSEVAMQYDLDFIIWGGDMAYVDGRPTHVYRWYEWFDANMNTLITDEGRVVPIIVGIGNHEVKNHYYYRHDDYEPTDAFRESISPFFYALFAFPGQPGYNVLDFGDYLSFVLPDTNHNNPIEGEQTQWLDQVLAERAHVTHLIPVYHVPAYPSHRAYDNRNSTQVREHWVPLFERHSVDVVFENHDHTYKRTYPIRSGARDASGITYIGDGAWGVQTRPGNSSDEWYIREFASERHAIIVTLHGTHRHMLVVNTVGEIIDEYPRTPGSPLWEQMLPELEGDGSEDDPYVISNVQQLQAMNEDRRAHFVLGQNIDARETRNWNEGAGFAPIGVPGAAFAGSFDGQGHKIVGLTINRPETDHVGLFGHVIDAHIQDLGLREVSVVGHSHVGTLAGQADDTKILSVRAEDVDIGGQSERVGGLIGQTWFDGTTIRQSYVRGGVVRGEDTQVGGMVGRTSHESSIYDSYTQVVVDSESSSTGGLVGHSSGNPSTFERVYSAPELPRGGGGLVGESHGGDTFRAAYWDRASGGSGEGVALTSEQMTGEQARRYMEFDFDDIWQTSTGYPELRKR